jgi:hypothetical protein
MTAGGKRIRRGVRLWTVAVSTFKSETYRFLRLERPTDEELAALGNAATTIRVLQDLGLRAVEDPFFGGLRGTYEGIS